MHAGDEQQDPAWVRDVLHFWFEELSLPEWFAKSDLLDQQIRDRFLGLQERLATDGAPRALTPRSALASVIVLDQFPRNLFRDCARAFATDPAARKLARLAIDQGFADQYSDDEKLFLYLPFEHSEDPQDQVLSLRLIGALGNAQLTQYAVSHKAIIDRFGRFPHRNEMLRRPSTPAEIEFLKEPDSRF